MERDRSYFKCDPQTLTDFPFKPNKAEFNNLKELLNDTAKQSLFEEQIKNSNPAQSRGEGDIIRPGTPADQEGSGGNTEKPKQPEEPAGAEIELSEKGIESQFREELISNYDKYKSEYLAEYGYEIGVQKPEILTTSHRYKLTT